MSSFSISQWQRLVLLRWKWVLAVIAISLGGITYLYVKHERQTERERIVKEAAEARAWFAMREAKKQKIIGDFKNCIDNEVRRKGKIDDDLTAYLPGVDCLSKRNAALRGLGFGQNSPLDRMIFEDRQNAIKAEQNLKRDAALLPQLLP